VKEANFRKNWLVEFESIKNEVSVRFGEEYFRNFSKIISKLARYHYQKDFLILGKEWDIYYFLIENGHNPYKVYRWSLLEKVPETVRFQLKNGMITQKTALHLNFKSRHENKNQSCIDIKLQILNLVRSM
jgi:hypothetical protein